MAIRHTPKAIEDPMKAGNLKGRPSGVTIQNLSFGYGGRKIFDKFRLHSTAKRIVLKGPSGCGKTTLLRLLFGSLTPEAGAILPRTDGKTVLVLQEDGLFPWLTGRTNINAFVDLQPRQLEEHPLFDVVSQFIDRPVHKMSYGQRRAVELFRAIVYRPVFLYLDEPFNFLDDEKTLAYIRILIELTSLHSQLVMTTHRHDESLDDNADVYVFAGDAPYSSLECQS